MKRIRVGLVACALIGGMAAACGGGKSSPASPSGVSPTGATIVGTVTAPGAPGPAGAAPMGGVAVTVSGTSLTGATDASGRFSLDHVPAGTIQLTFIGSGASAAVTLPDVTEAEHITVAVTLDGATATVDASERSASGKVEIEGLISEVGAGNLVVNGRNISVPDTATIRHGNTPVAFDSLQVGDRVHVRGTLNGEVVVAELVLLQNPASPPAPEPPPVPPVPEEKVELEGRIASIDQGALTMVVDTMDVSVPAGTEIRHGSTAVGFTELKVGDRVHVRGTMNGTTLVADLVLLQNDNAGVPVNIKGTVTGSAAGTCPTVTFSVQSWIVDTTGDTDFRKGVCADIKDKVDVHVFGTVQSSGNVLATWVQFGK